MPLRREFITQCLGGLALTSLPHLSLGSPPPAAAPTFPTRFYFRNQPETSIGVDFILTLVANGQTVFSQARMRMSAGGSTPRDVTLTLPERYSLTGTFVAVKAGTDTVLGTTTTPAKELSPGGGMRLDLRYSGSNLQGQVQNVVDFECMVKNGSHVCEAEFKDNY